jgi:hypothetical protein
MTEINEEIKKTYVITISETTLRELLSILEEHSDKKEHVDFIGAKSDGSNVEFEIVPEKKPQTQESLCYKFNGFGIFGKNHTEAK